MNLVANIAAKAVMPVLVLASMGLTGCMDRSRNSKPEQMVLPIVADDAMQKRDWAQSTAIYPNGGTAAGHTDFPFEPQPQQTWYWYALDDTAVFFVNMAILPYEAFKDPEYRVATYQGNTYSPSYTAMPVLPPSQSSEPETTYPALQAEPIPVAPPSGSAKATSIPSPRSQVTPSGQPVYSGRMTTSPTTRSTYNGLPVSPGAQPTGSPLVTPGRGQPQSPPITLPPPTPTHPSTQPIYPGQSSRSSVYTPAPSVAATPPQTVHTITPLAPATRPSQAVGVEPPDALDLSKAPPLTGSQSSNSTSASDAPLETKIVGGKLVLVPSTQPTTKPTTATVNWPPLNK